MRGRFDPRKYRGCIPNLEFMQRPAAEVLMTGRPEVERAVTRWDGLVCPVNDQGQTGMCETFSFLQQLKMAMRWLYRDETDVLFAPDMTLDPRPVHREARARFFPEAPYSPVEGLPLGGSATVSKDMGLVSPGTDSEPVQLTIGDMASALLGDSPLQGGFTVHDGFDPRNMNPVTGEIAMYRRAPPINGHAMVIFGMYVGLHGEQGLRGANSWDPSTWGWYGLWQMTKALFDVTAIDRPRKLVIRDPEWYKKPDAGWRRLLIRESVLAEEMAKLRG